MEQQPQLNGPTTPRRQRLLAITPARFSLFRVRSPLLTESLLFSLPVGTEMFHFPTFPPHALCVQAPVAGHDSSWVSPFGNPRITARLPTPRGFSQAPTTFIGSWCQGIHHVPLVACHYKRFVLLKDARVHYAVLKVRADRIPPISAHPLMEQQVVRRGMAQQRVSSAKARSLRTQQRARQSHHSLSCSTPANWKY